MKTKYKFGAILLICFLFGSILGYTLAQSANTLIISSGIYPSASSYTIWKEGSDYYVKDAYGFQPSWSGGTNASYIFQQTVNAFGFYGGEIAVGEGDYYFDTQVNINHDYIKIKGLGSKVSTRIKANNDNTKIFVVNTNSGTYISDFVIEGLYIEGGGQNTANGSQTLIDASWTYDFQIKDSTLTVGYIGLYINEFARAWVNNVKFWKNNNTNLYIDGGSGSALDYIYVSSSYLDGADYGIYIKGIDAYKIEHTSIMASGIGIYIERGIGLVRETIGVISDVDIDLCETGIEFFNATRVEVNSLWSVGHSKYGVLVNQSDSIQFFGGWIGANDEDGFYIYNSTRTVIDGVRIHDNNDGGSFSGIYLLNSNETIMSNLQMWDYSSISQQQAYGIREDGTSDYNMITSSNIRDSSTVNILVSGANTNTQFSWNGTTWIP